MNGPIGGMIANDNGWRRAWNSVVPRLVDADQPGDFADTLMSALQQVATFSHAVLFGYPLERRPVLLHHAFAAPERSGSLVAYVRGTYLLDPFYEACLNQVPEGVYRMEDLAPDDFYTSIGSHPGYISPCVSPEPGVLSEEIGFFAHSKDSAYIVLSLMRDGVEPPFSEAEMDRLREVAPLVCATMRRQFLEKVEAPARDKPRAARPSEQPDLTQAIAACATDRVTRREDEVATMMLRGHSSGSIAQVLGISVSTVKIHRRNLYEKLGVSSQAAFFALLLAKILENPEH
jgi:DNA-binding CsgD family transcriptional regulator